MKLTKANLGVHVFADNDSSRYPIDTVRANGRFTEATDGFFLARVATPEPTDDPDVLIPKGTAASLEESVAARKSGAIEEFADITIDGDHAQASTYGKDATSTSTFDPVTRRFPNSQAIFDYPVGDVQFTLGAGLLQTIVAFVAKFGDNGKRTAITFAWDSERLAMRFAATLKGDQVVSGVLMGMRTDKTFEQISASVPDSLPAKSKSMAAGSGDENEPE